MKPLIRRHRIIAATSLVLLLAVAGGLWWFQSAVAAREARVVEVRDQLASFEQNRRQLAQESEQLAVIRERTASLEQHLVTDDTTPTLLSSIESMASSRSVDLTLTAVVATSATGKTPAKLHIDFSAKGTFAGLERFIDDLLSQPYQVRVTRLSLYQMTESASAGQWQLLAGIDIISF